MRASAAAITADSASLGYTRVLLVADIFVVVVELENRQRKLRDVLEDKERNNKGMN